MFFLTLFLLWGVQPATTVGLLYEINCGATSVQGQAIRVVHNRECLSATGMSYGFAIIKEDANHEMYKFDEAGNRLGKKLLNEINKGQVNVRVDVTGEVQAVKGFGGSIKVTTVKVHSDARVVH